MIFVPDRVCPPKLEFVYLHRNCAYQIPVFLQQPAKFVAVFLGTPDEEQRAYKTSSKHSTYSGHVRSHLLPIVTLDVWLHFWLSCKPMIRPEGAFVQSKPGLPLQILLVWVFVSGDRHTRENHLQLGGSVTGISMKGDKVKAKQVAVFGENRRWTGKQLGHSGHGNRPRHSTHIQRALPLPRNL